MPMLADLDMPEPRRARGFVLGIAIAVPLALVVGSLTMPRLRAAIMQGAADHDARARAAAEFMGTVCSAPDPDRDQALCGCVLGAEFPGLDCMDRFSQWSLERQVERCDADEETRRVAVSFCVCEQRVLELAAAEDKPGRQRAEAAAGHERCRQLDDALELPDASSFTR